jgi:hypothetical protein
MPNVIAYKDRTGMVLACDTEFYKSLSNDTITSLGVTFYFDTPEDKLRLKNDFIAMQHMFKARAGSSLIIEGQPLVQPYDEGKNAAAIQSILTP